MGQYSIKEVETLSGVKAHTLRIWEQRYDFLKPKRTDTKIRYYTDEQLRLLLNIGTLNRNGMKISKIAELSEGELKDAVMSIHNSTSEPDNFLDSLIQSMIDFDEHRFEKTLSSAIMKLGFEGTFVKLIFPFMVRTGVLWTTGAVNVAQEHFISHLIRRKLKVAIDNQFVEVSEKSKKFILFLPEGETHELLLLFTDYLLRKQNHQVVYFGAFIPFEELIKAIDITKPDYLVTYLTVPLEKISVQSYLKKLSSANPKTKIIVGGTQLQQIETILPANCISVNSAEELFAVIK
ncbi:MAG: MerR family transcriptional regulator [Bacteroidetes bacterium]|nr:MerR family transcriptional regulator [Bacteroidota bacterium]